MLKAYCWLMSHLRSEKGASAVEYGLIVALIAVAIIIGAAALGENLGTLFNNIAGKLAVVVP